MQIKFRRFEVAPTLLTILGVGMMLYLGIWQLQRLEWKEGVILQVEAAKQAAPLTALPKDGLEALEFHRVTLEGRFLHAKELLQAGRYYGTQQGVHVVTPLQLADGRTILVDRGWVPIAKREPEQRPETLREGKVTVEGILRTGDHKRRFAPGNKEAEGLWLWRDLPAMQRVSGSDAVPIMIDQIQEDRSILPIGNDTEITLRNDHLGYAITWFVIAFAGLVIYLLYHGRPKTHK